jgi:hypothetical protein
MSNGNRTLPLALGTGGGFLLWYFLRDGKQDARAAAPPTSTASRTPPAPAVAAPVAPAAPAAPSPASAACALRLDAPGLTANGVQVDIAEAVNLCKLAGRADVTVTKEASATVYADLMMALGRAGVSVYTHRNGAGPRNAKSRSPKPRTVDDVDLPSFALMVQALADGVEPDPNQDGLARGRFGARKVFIAAIRRELRATKYASLPRAAIDELLIRAHREGLLQLARADLVAAMDPHEVRDSEIAYGGNATFHFVVVEPDTARNANAYRAFTLVTYPEGRKAGSRSRWFRAEPPTTWADARDRLGAAGILDRTLAGRTSIPGGWMLSVDPASFREELAEPLPGGPELEEAPF